MVNKNKDFCPALAAFIFLFVLAYVIDNSNIITMFPNFLHLDAKRYLILITVLIGIWTLLKPSSLFRSISFLVFVLLNIIVGLEAAANHILFEGVFILTILSSFVYLKIKNKNGVDYRTRYELKIPFVLLQSFVTFLAKNGLENIKLEYERDNEVIYSSNAEIDPLLSNASIFQIKLLRQRPILDDERGLCRW